MFYQGTKTAKAAAIGTIMPWSGSLGTIPKGWIVCDGQTEVASNYPLLVQAIADTYNAGTSNLGGSFPMYTGNIVLPNLNGKTLMDIEPSYFGTGSSSTGKLAEADSDAGPLISPFIGENQGVGIPTVFNDVYTDVIFTLNDRNGYQGKITGNTMIPGDGFKTVYIGPRKLGRDHIRGHNHSGSYETIDRNSFAKPGIGVVPYADVNFVKTLLVNDGNATGTNYDAAIVATIPNFVVTNAQGQGTISTSGFGQGQSGRIVAAVYGEVPPINLKAYSVIGSPLGVKLNKPFLGPGGDGGSSVPYGFGGANVTIPAGYRNFYPDFLLSPTTTITTVSETLDNSETVIDLNNASGFTVNSIVKLSDSIVGSPFECVLVTAVGLPTLSVNQISVIRGQIDTNPLAQPAGITATVMVSNQQTPRGTLVSPPAQDFTGTSSVLAHTHDNIEVVFDTNTLKPQSSITAAVNIPVNTVPVNTPNIGALQINFNTSQPSLTCLYIIRAY